MIPNRGPAPRQRRRAGGFLTAMLMAAATAVSAPMTASAQAPGSTLPETGNSSVDAVLGQLPEQIVIGGGGLGGSEAAQSVGQVVGSVAPLEAVGIAGGSAAASVASSGVIPGSVYTNPAGSIGSGTLGIGSIAISEYMIPLLGLQAATAYVGVLAQRQEAGTLEPHELDFWHGVVVGSAEGGAVIRDAAEATGTELPDVLAGSIDSVQIAAQQDPYEINERRRAEAQARSEAEAEVEAGAGTAGAAAFAATGGAEGEAAGDPGQAAPTGAVAQTGQPDQTGAAAQVQSGAAEQSGEAERTGHIPAMSIGA